MSESNRVCTKCGAAFVWAPGRSWNYCSRDCWEKDGDGNTAADLRKALAARDETIRVLTDGLLAIAKYYHPGAPMDVVAAQMQQIARAAVDKAGALGITPPTPTAAGPSPTSTDP